LDTYNDDRLPVIRNVLSRTEGLTDTIGNENPLFRSVFSHLAPWIVGMEFVQENTTERMSQLSLNYRESPLSVSHHASGTLRAGDRVPNLQVQLIGGQGSATREPAAKRLFQLLNTDRFTLLFANLKNSEATHHAVQASLSPWKSLPDRANASTCLINRPGISAAHQPIASHLPLRLRCKKRPSPRSSERGPLQLEKT
jgi:hypothetical protein